MMAALLPGAWLLPAGSPHATVTEVAAVSVATQAAIAHVEAPVAIEQAQRSVGSAADQAATRAGYAAAMEQAAARAEATLPQPQPEAPAEPTPSPTVNEVAAQACSTAVVRGLSDQLMAEIELLRPGTVASIEDVPGIEAGPGTLPYLQKPAVDALRKVTARGNTIQLNSALRSLAQQYLLHRWYQTRRCGIPLAAPPGTSHHESGLAIDISNYAQLRPTLAAHGWRWLGGRDPVHFDFVGQGGTRLGGLSVLAFQRLWNRNNPDDRIPEDGVYGPATAQRLARAPANGFPLGPEAAAPAPFTTAAVAPDAAALD